MLDGYRRVKGTCRAPRGLLARGPLTPLATKMTSHETVVRTEKYSNSCDLMKNKKVRLVGDCIENAKSGLHLSYSFTITVI